MANETAVAPAGDDENTSMSVEDAVAFMSAKDEPPASPEPVTPEQSEPEPETLETPAETVVEETPEQVEEIPAEPDPFDWDKVPGHAKFRLKDGTVFTGADVKKDLDELRQVRQTRQEVAAERQRVQQVAAQSAQYAQFLNNVLPAVVQKAQAMMPKPPEMPKYENGDFVGNQEKMLAYQADKDAYDRSVWELGQLQNAQRYQQQRAAKEQEEQYQRFVEGERDKLYEAASDLRDPVKAGQFEREFQSYGQRFGFSPQEINAVTDHRLIVLVKNALADRQDAEAYRKLKANPPKPVAPTRPAAAAPVAQPGPRVEGANASSKSQELLARARKSGGISIDEATRLLTLLEN